MVRHLTALSVVVTVWGIASAGGPWGAAECDEEAQNLRTLIVQMKNTISHLKMKLASSHHGAKPGKKLTQSPGVFCCWKVGSMLILATTCNSKPQTL